MSELKTVYESPISRAIKDIIAGTVAGSFQVLAGQPFDTVKVRLQSNTQWKTGQAYTGVKDCILRIIKEEGVSGFYKGTLTPLLGVGLCVGIQFFTNENMKRLFSIENKKFTLNQLYLSGAISGLANTIVAGPVEHIRIKQQMNRSQSIPTLKLIQEIYTKYGIRGLYKGQVLTMVRDFHAYGVYFSVYELLVQNHILQNSLDSRKQIPFYFIASYGIIAGFGYWLSTYPIDLVKSNMQADSLDIAKQKFTSNWQCFKFIYSTQGIKGFFSGLSPCLLRTIPAASATFLGFELMMKILN